jgi:hypothetical protein
MELTGIKYTKDAYGRNRYVHIDLAKYSENQLLEDFLDGIEAMAQKREETVSLDDFNKYIDERLQANV